LQGCGPKESLRVTSHIPGSVRKCEGMNLHTPKATPTLEDGVPMESQDFRGQFQGPKLNNLRLSLYHWKAFDESYNFASYHTSIQSLLAKLWGSKVAGILAGVILRLPAEKSHLDVGPVERCRVYYKEEGGGFPQVRAVVSLVCLCRPWLVLAPKVLQLCTNHLVWVVCRPV